jgi:DNA-binding PadR family transcriptional regulator
MGNREHWSGFGLGFGPGGPWWWRGPRGRRRRQWFESGDMKYVILEERMHGCYSPSPGTVYPTLQWLEDEGLVASQDVDGKKVYEITAAGLAFLDEHQDVVEDIFERVREAVDRVVGGSMVDVNRAMKDLMKAVYRTGWRTADDALRGRIATILRQAVADVEGLTAKS